MDFAAGCGGMIEAAAVMGWRLATVSEDCGCGDGHGHARGN